MYTNNDLNIVQVIKNHLEKGDRYFELYFAEQSMDQRRISNILEGFRGVSLPDHLEIILNFSTINMEDDIAMVLADKLSKLNWPSKVNIELILRNNFLTNEAASVLLDFCNQFDKFPEAKVLIDLDNNIGLTHAIIDDTLQKIKGSALNGTVISNNDNSIVIEFSNFLIKKHLSGGDESD